MHIRRFGPILTILIIIVLSAGLGRYLYKSNFPGRDLGPFKNTPSLTPIPTALDLDDLKVTRVAPQQPVIIKKNCTYHIYYWINRSQEWPAMIELGGSTYDRKSSASLFLEWRLDLSKALTAQFYTAILNVLYGASQKEINPYLVLANEWIKKHSESPPETAADREKGILLFNILEQYNIGRIGPGACEDQPPTPISGNKVNLFDQADAVFPTATPTFTPIVSVPTLGATNSPTPMPTQGRRPPPGVATATSSSTIPIRPSSTITPTIARTETATRTVLPSATRYITPSSTPHLPTDTAAPTPTSNPPATRTNTPLPTVTTVPSPTEKPPAPATDTPAPSATTAPTQTDIPPAPPTDTPAPPAPTATNTSQPPATLKPTRTPRPTRTPKP